MVPTRLLSGVSMAALLLTVSAVQQARAQGRMGVRSHVELAAVTAVQKELKLGGDKEAKVQDLAKDYMEDMRSQMSAAGLGGRGNRDASPEEQQKRMQQRMEIAKNLNEKYLPKLHEILDEAQRTRLHEIAIQAAGPHAFQEADVEKALELTSEQQDKIKTIAKDFHTKLHEAMTSGEAPDRTKIAELTDEWLAKDTDVLTKDQQEKFAKMKGKPFDLKSLNTGRRRGGARRLAE